MKIFKKYQKLVIGNDGTTSSQQKKTAKVPKKKEDGKTAKSKAKITEIPEPCKTVEIETSLSEKTTEDTQKIEDPSKMVPSSDGNSPEKTRADPAKKPESENTSRYDTTWLQIVSFVTSVMGFFCGYEVDIGKWYWTPYSQNYFSSINLLSLSRETDGSKNRVHQIHSTLM